MSRNTLAFGVEPARHKFRLRLARYQGLAEALAGFVNSPRGGGRVELLDVGVGNGRTLRYCEAAGVADRIAFHGVDNSPRRLAAVYGGDRWELKLTDAEGGLPYPDGRFDAVVCEQLLEHVPNPADVVREMVRVLGPGGLLVVGVPVFRPAAAYLRRSVVPKLDRVLGVKRDHVQAFSRNSICRLLDRVGGLTITDVRGFRVASGGPLRFLENSHRWYRFHRFLGRHLPGWCIEVQILATKEPASLAFPAAGHATRAAA